MGATIAQVRQAFADYVATEGCSCCRDIDGHRAASERLGKMLNVKKYSDGSGYDFYAYKTKDRHAKRNKEGVA